MLAPEYSKHLEYAFCYPVKQKLMLALTTPFVFLAKSEALALHVALFSYATLVSTSGSIAQQLHTIVVWEDVKTEQFYYVHDNLGSPELAIAGPSYGLDLVLFYIQPAYWVNYKTKKINRAFALAFAIFKPSESIQHHCIRRRRGIISKVVAFVLPAVFISFLQIPAVRNSTPAFITLADISLAASLSLGSILVIVILAKYIQTRRKIHRWTVRFPLPRDPNDNGEEEQESLYDGWLIVRFAIALLFIEAFQILTILSEVAQTNNNKKEALPAEPDISAAHAKVDFVEFIPGVSAGLLVFLVFGTTRTCQRTIFSLLIPRRFRAETTLVDNRTSTPRFDHQSSTFLTSPSLESSSRPTPELIPSQLGEQTPRSRSSYSELERTRSQSFESRATDEIENQEVDNTSTCSRYSSDANNNDCRGKVQEEQSSTSTRVGG
ncbi:hypothetical protein FHL15_010751 [Xylaria flabelliformis]|uniref:Uncharacterized protein n=1 Tax=Xylaria flabelliformis TaxID=2512241 RepID=A0A553HK96_9PEZI|nr:hypothetical protein FHL15_010751 [Xylaria flabelliformis]